MKNRILLLATVFFAQLTFAQNPVVKDKFTADPAAMVHKDTVYLYYNSDGTMQTVEQTVEGTSVPPKRQYNTHTADNGNGTYTNPLFFEDVPD
ncbi:MAG: hypothetical protein LBJ72_08720, partial [Dysgonamonadaceae bacterium]|nr:hypothetical protein [Dysgonamonadaceae bacterium]